MVSDWKNKLFDAIKADGRKHRAIGIAAKLGPNFISQMRGTDSASPKEPSLEKVLRLCEELRIDPVSLFTDDEPKIAEKSKGNPNVEHYALKAKLGEQFAELLLAEPKFQQMAITLIDDFIQSTPLKSRITKTKEKSSSMRT